MVGTHKYMSGTYYIISGTRKTSQAEYGPSVPVNIDAADMEDVTHMVYLINGK